VSNSLASTHELKELLDTALNTVTQLFDPADAGIIFSHLPEEALVANSAVGFGEEALNLRFQVGEGLVGRTFATASGAVLNSPESVREALANIYRGDHVIMLETAGKTSPQSAICAPLIFRGTSMGAILLIGLRSSPVFQPEDLQLLQAVANQIAVGIENARLAKEASQAEALREADRLKSEFVSTVSHELRTPLASIKAYATALLRQDVARDEGTVREYLQTIDEEGDRLRELVDNLLDMSRIEAGALRLDKRPTSIARIVRKTIQELRVRSGIHRLEVNCPEDLPLVTADAGRLQRVLHNLIENAIKYSPEGGEITICAEAEDGIVQVSVLDEGIGIDPEHRDKIFERFYRTDNVLTRQVGGSGLGLAICRGIIEAHGGRIWAEGRKEKGAAFHFTLAVAQEQDFKEARE